MKPFENDLPLRTPISHDFLMSMRALGEHRGRQVLYTRQFPEVLETLRRAALLQGTESSCRLDGIGIPPERMTAIVAGKAGPRDGRERIVAGYRDILAQIQSSAGSLWLSADLVRGWHGTVTEASGAPSTAMADLERVIELFQQSLIEGRVDPLILIADFLLDFSCMRTFGGGMGRLGRLLAVFLLLQNGYDAVRYVALERILEGEGEAFADALRQGSRGWTEGKQDLAPWWGYCVRVLTAVYRDFESRVGRITSSRGAKREMVRRAVEGLPRSFAMADIRRACPGVSAQTFQRALDDLVREDRLRIFGRGADTRWERTEE